MPFTRPHAYVDATAIAAADVRDNHESLRRWLNQGLEAADLDDGAVDWTAILAGEYLSVTRDHRFTTGNHYAASVDGDPAHQSAWGLSLKSVGADVALWHPIQGRRIYVARANSLAIVSGYLAVIPDNDLTVDSGISDNAHLFLDGVQVDGTQCRFFAAETGTTSDADGDESSRWRVAAVHVLLTGLDQGWHAVEWRVDPSHDLSLVYSRSLQIEIFEV